MRGTESFQAWLQRVRSGDQHAAAELVRQYGPGIHEAIRLRLIKHRLYRSLDAMDICQTVLGAFFSRALRDTYVIQSPEKLQSLLRTMAHNKVKDEARKQHAGRRDCRRVEESYAEDGLDSIVASDPTPSTIVAGQELIEEVQRRLTPEERELFKERASGLDWAAIAHSRNASAETLRKKLSRAVTRVTRQLGLDDFCTL